MSTRFRMTVCALLLGALSGCGGGDGGGDTGSDKAVSLTIRNTSTTYAELFYASATRIVDGMPLPQPEATFDSSEGMVPGEQVTFHLDSGLYRIILRWDVSDLDEFELLFVGGSWLLGARKGVHSLDPV
jgi:hypothetical protein